MSIKERIKNFEKLSTYECGFSNFSDSRSTFEVSFYIIAILFLIFDVEIVLFIPFIFILLPFNIKTFLIFFFLLFLLFLGFILEWKKISILD